VQILTRAEAGRRLATGLAAIVKDTPAVVAISPGGVAVASEIARAFRAPLDVIGVERLEVPGRPRSIFGAVADGAVILLKDRIAALGLPRDYVDALVDLARREVDRLAGAWRGDAPPVPLAGRSVILADDGRSEAVLMAAAARALREAGTTRVVYAAPYAAPELCSALRDCCDERLLLFDAGSPTAAYVVDPSFAQATRFDVRSMVRRSRTGLEALTEA
jgi:putative phosphoribosyl transferase